ncbi:MAG: hypothetical protein SF187_20315 [Deltaproteobacteria bacterium]|nr:hypothetical protein [Deltaproteobacteria bacterium]
MTLRFRPILVCVVAAIAGCDNGVKTQITSVELVRTTGVACRGTATGGPLQIMDAHIIEAYEVIDGSVASFLPSFCQDCFSDQSLCRAPSRVCRCGAPTVASPAAMAEAMSGTIIDLAPDRVYCLRALSIETGQKPSSTAGACACDPAWSTRAFLDKAVRLCALGPPASSAQFDQRLSVRCANDIVAAGSLFHACYQPMLP